MQQIQNLTQIIGDYYILLKQVITNLYTQSCFYSYTSHFDIVDTALAVFILVTIVSLVCKNFRIIGKGYNQSWISFILARLFMMAVNYIPGVLSYIEKKKEEANHAFQQEMDRMTQKKTFRLPDNGMSHDKIIDRLQEWIARDSQHYGSGKVSGSLYVAQDQKFMEGIQDFCKQFIYSNPMHADLWPATRQMEAEVIKMTGELFGQEKESIGIVTTGGTESILLSMLAYRNWAQDCKGINQPNIVIPETAHAAFYRAGEYFKIEVRIAKITSDYIADISDLKKHIDSNTICIVGSFPNYPYGTHDPIEQLALIAKKKKLVFMLTHAQEDLQLYLVKIMEQIQENGHFNLMESLLYHVININMDQHLKVEFAFFSIATWSGGCYAAPSIQGSKTGVSVAGAWFALQYLGKKKYVEYSKKIMDSTQLLAKQLNQIPEISVCGNPMINVVTFKSNHSWLNAYSINQLLTKQGWVVGSTQNPAGVHLSITLQNVNNLNQYVIDVKKAIAEIQANPNQYKKGGSQGTLYGTTQKIPDSKFAGKALKIYLDSLLKI